MPKLHSFSQSKPTKFTRIYPKRLIHQKFIKLKAKKEKRGDPNPSRNATNFLQFQPQN